MEGKFVSRLFGDSTLADAMCCIVYSSTQFAADCHLLLHADSSRVCLRVQEIRQLEEDSDVAEVLVPWWVMSALRLGSGEDLVQFAYLQASNATEIGEEPSSLLVDLGLRLLECQGESQDRPQEESRTASAPLVLSSRCRLKYRGLVALCNWDEVDDGAYLSDQFQASPLWPREISQEAVLSILRTWLPQILLVDSTVFAIDCGNRCLIFEADISSVASRRNLIAAQPFVGAVPEPIQQEQEQEQEQEREISRERIQETTQTSQMLSFEVQPLSQVVVTCLAVFGPSELEWTGPRSFVLSAPEGGGKSYCLSRLEDWFYRNGPENCRLIRINGKEIPTQAVDVVEFESTGGLLYHVSKIVSLANPSFDDSSSSISISSDSQASQLEPNSSVLLLMDDIDRLMSSNEQEEESPASLGNVQTDRTILLRTVFRSLLQSMSRGQGGSYSTCRLVVVATTARSESEVTKPLHGFPEFSKVLSLRRPSKSDRRQLLEQALRELEHSAVADPRRFEAWAQQLSEMTPGYLPGDLISIAQRAQLICTAETAVVASTQAELTWKHMLLALSRVQPVTLRDIGSNVVLVGDHASKSTGGIGGYRDVVAKIERLLRSGAGEMSESSGFSTPNKGIVFYGPSGCGKSRFASFIAERGNLNMILIRSTEILSKYLGQTEASIRQIFQKAKAMTPCLLFFDDFDDMAANRSKDGDTGGGGGDINSRILSTFLNELDGVGQRNSLEGSGSLFVAVACRDIGLLDEALIRPGRLQYHFHLNKPTESDIHDIIQLELAKIPCDSSIDIPHIVQLILHRQPSCADVKECCSRAAWLAMREAISCEDAVCCVTMTHFERLLVSTK